MQTAADLFKRVRRRAGLLARRAGDPSLVPTGADEDALLDYVKDGLVEIARRTRRFEDSAEIETVAGQACVGVTIALDSVHSVECDSANLEHRAGADVREWGVGANAASGKPKYFGLTQGVLWLYPVPDAVYTLSLLYSLNGAVAEEDNIAPDWLIS